MLRIKMNRASFGVLMFAVFVMAAPVGATPISISDNFDSGTLNSNLQDANGGYSLAAGAATRNADGSRQYIRTVATDYNTTDFVAEVTFNIGAYQNGYSNMFFGIGDGVPNAGNYGEPTNGLVFVNTTNGEVAFKKTGPTGDLFLHDLSTNAPQVTTGRIRMTKTGDTLAVAYDAAYDGTFSADYTYSTGFNALASGYLDNTNSRIIFGTGRTENSFGNFSVTVPEPGSLALIATGLLGLLCYAWRRRK